MDSSDLQVLDRAIEAGGRDLAGTTIAGKGKPANAALKRLCDLGHLELRGKKYMVTYSGRGAWETESPPERVAEVKEVERKNQFKALTTFLITVEAKSG